MSECTKFNGDIGDACSRFRRYYQNSLAVRRAGEAILSLGDVHQEFMNAGFCAVLTGNPNTDSQDVPKPFTDWDCEVAIRRRYDLSEQI